MHDVLLTGCEVDGVAGVDVRVQEGVVVETGGRLSPGADDELVAAAGGALLPGLHDHHLHVLAMAAAHASVDCGPPAVRDRDGLVAALRRAARAAAPGSWVRGTGYHESVAGPLDSATLDALVADRPVRVQHRSGALWVLNGAALREAGLREDAPAGLLFRRDRWLRERVPPVSLDVREVGCLLAMVGVTGVTDATPDLDDRALALLTSAVDKDELPQRLLLLGAPLTPPPHGCNDRIEAGPWKLVLDEGSLDPAGTAAAIVAAHASGRAVAIHCVTGAEVVVAVDALDRAGTIAGDRLEHASVLPDDFGPRLRELGIAVVTQPNFIAERGDAYMREVQADDLDALYRCGSLLRVGVQVAAGTDAPFGMADPWRAMRAAVSRCTDGGGILNSDEAVEPGAALELFLSEPHHPGGRPRRVQVGVPADLCLLHTPLASALAELDAGLVATTIIGGRIVHRA